MKIGLIDVDSHNYPTLPYEEMVLVTQALNRLADFEDAEIEMDKRKENEQ